MVSMVLEGFGVLMVVEFVFFRFCILGNVGSVVRVVLVVCCFMWWIVRCIYKSVFLVIRNKSMK